MNKKTHSKVLLRVLVALLAVTLLFGTFAAPQAEASSGKASYIERLNDVKLDITDYLDSNVAYQLPEGVSDDELISIIIDLPIVDLLDAYEATDKTMSFSDFALESDEAKQTMEKVKTEKDQILSKLDNLAIGYTVGDDYTVLMAGFEIVIRAGDFKAICKTLDYDVNVMVCEVYNVAETQLVENDVNVYDTGIIDSSMVKYDGSGMVVAVLDTGIDYAHSAFSLENFHSTHLGMTKEDVAKLVGNTIASTQYAGLTVDDVYYNEKIPYMFDYADQDPDAYSTHNMHGTHVSGIILGKDDTITGVAPNAQLVSMKVFSDVYDSAKTSWILSALEDCVVLGVDAINMSLGTSCGFSRPSDEHAMTDVYDRIKATGISMIVAASNDYHSAQGSEKNGNLPLTSNPDVGTVGSPSTLEAAMSVASINGVKTPYIKFGDTIMYFNESNTNAGKERNFFEGLLGDEDGRQIEFVVIPGVGRAADYTGLDVNGKIALVRRGDTTFEEKALIAQHQGAAGIIIYNNVAGDIKMNCGDATLAMCSINQDDGEKLAASGGGLLSIDKSQTSGPFMSDFSSWGPTPDLKIKPEITQHGGNILSADTGGGYDRISGTSMACPNLCGLAVLLRQYVVENFPEIADDSVAINDMVSRLMMSTADIIINKNGQPYAVRKQGAGLANLLKSIETKAIILTYDENGDVMSKTKLELGDDKAKTGVYEMTFAVQNFGSAALSYDIGAYVLTEGVSETLTSHGETTVTQTAHPLSGAKLEITDIEGGTRNGMNITVNGGTTAKVTVKITLSDADKKYLDDSFKNGMYVEGFITLDPTAGTEVNMSVPYLAFYGDWTVAPQLDLDYFQTDADERDNSILPQDKVMADAFATRPLGGLYDDYVNYMGSYYFLQNPKDMVIAANKEFVALSNVEGSVHSLRYIYAGMLRNAAKAVVTITNDATGEVIYQTEVVDIRKSHGIGTIYPGVVEIEFDAADYNLANNTQLTVRMETFLDYEDGGKDTNLNNVFEFPMTIDFQAPTVSDVEFYYEYDKTLEKNRLYADISVFDNHYAMALHLGYIVKNGESIELKAFSDYLTPVYSVRNGTTVVTVELTDYLDELTACYSEYNDAAFVVSAYDYAMNVSAFEIGLPDNYVDFYMNGLENNTLVLSPNEIFNMDIMVHPDTEWGELLEITARDSSVAGVVNNKIIAKKPGTTMIKMQDTATGKYITFNVKVLAEGEEGYKRYDKPAVDSFDITGYYTLKAYHMVSSEDRDIGEDGQTRHFSDGLYLSMYPSESVALYYDLKAYFPENCVVKFTAGDSKIVTVDENTGVVVAQAEGASSITAKVYMDGQATYYTQTIAVEVKDPYVVQGGWLMNYYGLGGVVEIPERFGISTINNFAFSNYSWEMKTPEELAYDDSVTSIQRPIGDNTITKVIIPEGVEQISAYAFAYLTALEEVVFPSTLKHIDQYAFLGCENLKYITFSSETNNLKIINNSAFADCDLQGTLNLSSAYVISDYAFAGNEDLKGIILPETLMTIGSYAFAGCEKLYDVQISAERVKYGAYAFVGCTSLTEMDVNTSLIPAGMFYGCTNLSKITIGPDVAAINEFAFNGTKISNFIIDEGNTAFRVENANYILSADGKELVAVAPSVSGKFTASSIGGNEVVSIGRGAFSHNLKITSVSLPTVTNVNAYGFAYYDTSKPDVRAALTSINLGTLTNIGEFAFYGLKITEMPAFNSNATIGKYAFSNTFISSVNIADNVVIPEGMFAECSKLTNVTIGNNVVIGDYAFLTNRDYNYTTKRITVDSVKTKYAYEYVFTSSLKVITIGDNAVIGKSAFQSAASVENVTLGQNAQIGEMAFYNCGSLKSIDLSKATAIGKHAFSGDVFYAFTIDEATGEPTAVITKQGTYVLSYNAPLLTTADLSSATMIGELAFCYNRELTSVTLSENLTEIGAQAFLGCVKLSDIDLKNVKVVGEYAFAETALVNVNLSSVDTIGKYAFVKNPALTTVTLNQNGCVIGEGAFVNCDVLATVENMQYVTEVGAYAFANTVLTEADLSSAVKIGDNAFMKSEMAPLAVKLGENLVELGENPFAFCVVAPFSTMDTVEFNGTEYSAEIYDFQISDTIYVINGSLYMLMPNGGFEMITYTGASDEHAFVADGTVRVSDYAFAGTAVKMVTMPHTVKAVGHKAFFGCDSLQAVVFTGYEAPIFEEQYDQNMFNAYTNIPGFGVYAEFTNYDGNDMVIEGLGIVPYFMWNVMSSSNNIFYGANFVNYVGYVENKIMMVRPSNGQHYGTFIHDLYFDQYVDGSVAAQDVTLAAIEAISKIPARVELVHKDIVAAARAAYAKIATMDQQALVTNYEVLVKAERRLTNLQITCACGVNCGCEAGCVCGVSCCDNCGCMPVETPDENPEDTNTDDVTNNANDTAKPVNVWMIFAIVATALVVVAGVIIAVLFVRMRKAAGVAVIPAAEEVNSEVEENETK